MSKRLLGHQRIFQQVFNDLDMRHEIVTDKDGKQRYAYVYDGIDPYELEDSYFPGTLAAIKQLIQEEVIAARIDELQKLTKNMDSIGRLTNYAKIRAFVQERIAELSNKSTTNELCLKDNIGWSCTLKKNHEGECASNIHTGIKWNKDGSNKSNESKT